MLTQKLLEKYETNKSHSSCNCAKEDFSNPEKAAKVFSILKNRLSDIRCWNQHSAISSYALFNRDGTAHASFELTPGLLNRITLTASGKSDWVEIISVTEAADELVITVKPTFDPTAQNVDQAVISHFFTDQSTNNFCVYKTESTVEIYVIGLNEKVNTSETASAFQTLRNIAVSFGATLGIQSAEWDKFCEDFLTSAKESAENGSD